MRSITLEFNAFLEIDEIELDLIWTTPKCKIADDDMK